LVEKSSRLDGENPAARPLKNGSLVYLHHGTSRVAAKISHLEGGRLGFGEKTIAQLKLGSPIFAFVGDRFFVRDSAEQKSIGAGVDLNEIRSALRIQQAHIIEALVADLCAGNFIRKRSVIACASHRPKLPTHLQLVETGIREALSKQPFDPQSRKVIEATSHARQVVRFLIENGDLIEIAPDVVLLRENFEEMKSKVAELISKNGPATVSELRQALGSSRRGMVPLP